MTILNDKNEPLFIQVAGHYNIHALDTTTLAKPCTLNELVFYQTAANSALSGHIPALRSHIINSDLRLPHCIMIENLLSKFRHPSVMDTKLGRRYYGYNVSSEKQARMTARSQQSTSGSLAIRICGTHYDRDFGYALSEDTVISAFRILFDSTPRPSSSIRQFIAKLGGLKKAMESVDVRLYGCSLLVIVETDSVDMVDAKLIDFAHSVWEPGAGVDKDAVDGIRSIIALCSELLDEYNN